MPPSANNVIPCGSHSSQTHCPFEMPLPLASLFNPTVTRLQSLGADMGAGPGIVGVDPLIGGDADGG